MEGMEWGIWYEQQEVKVNKGSSASYALLGLAQDILI